MPRFNYGAPFGHGARLGGIVNIANRQLAGQGSAKSAFRHASMTSQIHDARIYFSQPTLRYFPLETIASVCHREERNPATSTTEAFNFRSPRVCRSGRK